MPLAGTLPLLPVVDALRDLGGMDGGAPFAEALDSAPGFVREELGRLLPQFGQGGGKAADGWDGGWRRERLFSAVSELLTAVARPLGSGVGLVIKDVHWADSATLDCLTFLTKADRRAAITVVVTCRGDEAPLAAHVAGWLADTRGRADVEEILLGPLSRAEVAEQVTALAAGTGQQPSPHVVDELYARAEGNPFFTEQLQAAGRLAEELPARVTAAQAAEQVFGYAEAAAHWQRAIELCRSQPDAAAADETG